MGFDLLSHSANISYNDLHGVTMALDIIVLIFSPVFSLADDV